MNSNYEVIGVAARGANHNTPNNIATNLAIKISELEIKANLAPSGSAANTLAKETGIPSQTLSSFLRKYDGFIHDHLTAKGRKALQEEFKNKIIILDESSFASPEQMYRL